MCRARAPGLLLLLLGWAVLQAGCGEDLAFRRPRLIRPGLQGRALVVYDAAGHRVMVFDRQLKRRSVFTHPDFDNLWGMDCNDRFIALANQRSLDVYHSPEEKKQMAVAEIMIFDYDGNLQHRLSWTGETGPTIDPRNLMLFPDGSFLIGDIRVNRLVHLDPGGRLIQTIATYGFDPGRLFYPNDTRLTPDGKLLVVDAFNSRLQLFRPDGSFERVVAESGTEPGQVRFPQVAAFDAEGRLYCTELATMRVSVFDRDLSFRGILRPSGSETMQLFGICAMSDPDEIFVADVKNSRIVVFDSRGEQVRTLTRIEP